MTNRSCMICGVEIPWLFVTAMCTTHRGDLLRAAVTDVGDPRCALTSLRAIAMLSAEYKMKEKNR